MKKLILISSTMLVSFTSFSQMEVMGMVYKNAKDLERNIPVTVFVTDSSYQLIDSVVSKDGSFDLKFTPNNLGRHYLFFKATGFYPDIQLTSVVTLVNNRWLVGVILATGHKEPVGIAYLEPDPELGAYNWVRMEGR